MKFVQDDEIPEMKMRKQLFELVKFLRGASRNLWSFLQGRDNRRDEQGKSEGSSQRVQREPWGTGQQQ
jgi:hypothetical protein